MKNYYCIKDNGSRIELAPPMLWPVLRTPTKDEYNAAGYWEFANNQPEVPDGKRISGTSYVIDGDVIKAVYAYDDIVYTREDYDAAMEEHLLAERTARGYTTRDPSEYVTSSVARFKHDAEDWVAHRDAVMTYALGVINTYAETGKAPTLAEFKAALPAITWTEA